MGSVLMYRVVLECTSIPDTEGDAAARDITEEFAKHRRHHNYANCVFSNGKLILSVENDFDPEGLALMDEFSDCVCAYVLGFVVDIERSISVISVVVL
jgi:hypothetical protein